MDTTAIIQFIGIVLFSSAIQNDPGVHAILPRIDHVHKVTPSYGQTPQTAPTPDTVEPHVAVLLYRNEDVLTRSGTWKRSGMLEHNWQYVVLDGENVEFVTNTRNPEPRIPSTIPRAMSPDPSCPSATVAPFRPEFQAPKYMGAAAVVDIPFGNMDACAAAAASGYGNSRVDTIVTMKTNGALLITGKKEAEENAKVIALDGDAVVYVVNVPPYYLFNNANNGADAKDAEEEPGGLEHWQAYLAMLDTPCHTRPQDIRPGKSCNLSAISKAWSLAQANPPSAKLKILDAGCSNTQWP